MKQQTPRRHYPLQIHIASLFTILILIVGVTLAWIGYRQISNLAFDNTEILFTKTADELVLQFQKDYRPVATSVRLLANAAISRARNLEDRMKYTPLLAEVIRDEPQIAAFHVGYSNGDFFIMLPLSNDHIRAVFSAPDEAFYVVNHISHNDNGANRQIRIFLAEQLEPVGEPIFSTTDFDPRQRPWYQEAESSSIIQVTSPYLFLSLQETGVTISKYSPRGKSTVAADVTLESLAETLQNNKITSSTFSLIYNANEEVLSHNTSGIGSPFEHINEKRSPSISDLPESLAETTRQLNTQPGQVVPFMHNGERWFGSVRELAMRSLQIRLLIAAPERELLAAAFAARRISIIVTVLVILLALPIAWFIANQVARPMRLLAREAQDIAGFNFDKHVNIDSVILEVEQLTRSMDSMRVTIGNFFRLITSLSGESDIDRLLDRVTDETMQASNADAAVIYLLSDDETELNAQPARLADGTVLTDTTLPALTLDGNLSNRLLDSFLNKEVIIEKLAKDQSGDQPLLLLAEVLKTPNLTTIVLPLTNRDNAGSGLLCLLYNEQNQSLESALSPEHIGFAQAMSGFAAV